MRGKERAKKGAYRTERSTAASSWKGERGDPGLQSGEKVNDGGRTTVRAIGGGKAIKKRPGTMKYAEKARKELVVGSCPRAPRFGRQKKIRKRW